MPFNPQTDDIIRGLIHQTIRRGDHLVGTLPEQALHDVRLMTSPHRTPFTFLSTHGGESRFTNPNSGWSEQRTIDSYKELLDSGSTRAIPNILGRSAPEALWLPSSQGMPVSLFAPMTPIKGGDNRIITVMEQAPDRITRHLNEMLASAKAAPHIQDHIRDVLDQYRSGKLPAVAAGIGAGGSLVPGDLLGTLPSYDKNIPPDVQAARDILHSHIPQSNPAEGFYAFPSENAPGYYSYYDKPLGTPWFDPTDAFTSPIGAVGVGGKALAAAASPFVSAGTNWLMEKTDHAADIGAGWVKNALGIGLFPNSGSPATGQSPSQPSTPPLGGLFGKLREPNNQEMNPWPLW